MKFKKALLAIPLAMGLAVLAAPSAHAANPPLDDNGALVSSDASSPIQVGITKYLQTPVGTIIPTDLFTFSATGNEMSTDDTPVPIGPAPALNSDNMSLSYVDGTDQVSANGDVVTATMNTGDIIDGVQWPHAGIYQYTVTETGAPSSTDPSANPYVQWTDSTASYLLTVYVANCTTTSNCASDQSVYVYAVTDMVVSEDSLNPAPAPAGTKVDPTPGGDTGASGMAFTNNYVKTDNPNGSNPTTNPSLTISKAVTGALGDKTKYFDFTVSVNPSSLDVYAPTSYMAYIVDSNGIVEDVTDNGLTTTSVDSNGDTYVEVPADGSAFSFSLKDGQSLNFVGVADGTTYDVNEVNPTGYEPSYTVTTGETPVAPTDPVVLGNASGSAGVGQSLDTSTQLVADTTDGGANLAAYTNLRDIITPTGLTMSQLPFVGLFAVVLLALVAFIVVRARAGRKAQANA